MKITAITPQQKDRNRVNIMVDGKYRFSLDMSQLTSLGLKSGDEYSEAGLQQLEQESTFGKVYMRALEYCLVRPRSSREMRDYLRRKTLSTRSKTGQLKPGISQEVVERVFDKLAERSYIDDERFTEYWIENRNLVKGISQRKLRVELMAKGIDAGIINDKLQQSERDEASELDKVITKKRPRYPDQQKLIAYLMRQGFSYGDVRSALDQDEAD